jgi:hypothetical protein
MQILPTLPSDGASQSPCDLPDGWFVMAASLFPGLTAPGVRLMRERVPNSSAMTDHELEHAVITALHAELNGVEDCVG